MNTADRIRELELEIADLNRRLIGVRKSWGALTASDVPIVDAGDYFTGTEVETALQEVGILIPILYSPVAIYFGAEGTPVNQEYDITGTTWVTSTDGTPNVASHLTADVLTAIGTAYNDAWFTIREGGGVASDTAPLTVQFNFTGITTFSQIKTRRWYHGSASHFLNLEAWNVHTSAWQVIGQVSNDTHFNTVSYDVLNPSELIAAGVVKIRFRHIQNGVTSHYLEIDWLKLSTGSGGGGGVVQTAIQTPSSATGDVAATNVQAAIAELASEKTAFAFVAAMGTL